MEKEIKMIHFEMSPIVRIWISYTLIVLAIIFIVIIWAIKNKQFRDQKKASHLPLESYVPENNASTKNGSKKID